MDSIYCPHCLESMPSAEAKLKKNRCSSCFNCPSCHHTLSTRATTVPVPSTDDPTKNVPKKVYYLACSNCRWTTRDAGLADQNVASGGWTDVENPHTKRLSTLLDYYRQLAKKEKTEKERRKYSRRRSYLHFSDKYGLTSVAARKRAGLATMASLSLKEGEEVQVIDVETSEAVDDVEPLDESIFTEALMIEKVSTMPQRLACPEFQPDMVDKLHPIHKHLLMKRSLRCRECEHNLSKPEYSAVSIKFKIQLMALYFVPEIKIMTTTNLQFGKESRVVLTMSNPSDYITKVSLRPREGENLWDTAKVILPGEELLLSARDDAAAFDDTMSAMTEFKDNPDIVVFRKSCKIGFFLTVAPMKSTGDVKISFMMRYNHHNVATPLPSKDASEPPKTEVIWMDHPVFINLGPMDSV